jgi:hypothetical protein
VEREHQNNVVATSVSPSDVRSPRSVVYVANTVTCVYLIDTEPPLWSSGQSSWLQIQRSEFDSRRYQIL